MAVKVEPWKGGIVQECTVTFEPDVQIDGNTTDANFTITGKEGEQLAEGYCYIPTELVNEASCKSQLREVRFSAMSNMFGSTDICANDIKFGGKWLSDLYRLPTEDETLFAHGRR